MKECPGTAPIHSRARHLDDISESNIFLPSKKKVLLEPIKPSNSPERKLKKLLYVTNIQKSLSKSSNKKNSESKRYITETK